MVACLGDNDVAIIITLLLHKQDLFGFWTKNAAFKIVQPPLKFFLLVLNDPQKWLIWTKNRRMLLKSERFASLDLFTKLGLRQDSSGESTLFQWLPFSGNAESLIMQ